ncbi:MAG TPA: hypothetical protein DCS93_15610 [Microscillaceae bacterium]|nr:hypothetical protein [Microscillaceae bacterium]
MLKKLYILLHTIRHFSVVETHTEADALLAVSPRPTLAKMSSSMILLIGILTTGCVDPISYKDPDLIKWKGLTEDSAKKVVSQRVPLGLSPDSVKVFLKKQQLTFSEVTPNDSGYYITASTAIKRENVMMKSKWLLKFYFDPNRKLTQIDIRKGLISF